MRTGRKPLQRLLNSFPVKALRHEWEAKGRTKIDVINYVMSKVEVQNISNFVEKSMGLTKQHVCLYEHDLKRLSLRANNERLAPSPRGTSKKI